MNVRTEVLPCFSDYKTHLPHPQIWEENGGASYNLNVAYLARWGGRGGWWGGFFPIFLYNLGESYGPVRLTVRKTRYMIAKSISNFLPDGRGKFRNTHLLMKETSTHIHCVRGHTRGRIGVKQGHSESGKKGENFAV